jgi:hypothetical protein
MTSSKIWVVPNERGGWSLRNEGETELLGNYPTSAAASKIAHYNSDDVEVVEPKSERISSPIYAAMANSARVDDRLIALMSEPTTVPTADDSQLKLSIP